jgi:DNA uptake protein ComE-like DNA-binding protein
MISRNIFVSVTFALLTMIVLPAWSDGLLNANEATERQLSALPQLSGELSNRIVSARPFKTWGDLHELLAASLSDEQLEKLYGSLFVPLKLNSAADADIQLIPGVGRRMAHEFEEYRPYTSMEQFRREIGKYVDADEVARYEQYVILE